MDDLISRQAAIDALERTKEKNPKGDIARFYNAITDRKIAVIEDLPSAQPEIVWCKDCKNWYAFSDKKFGYCRRECWDDDGQYRLKVETMYDDFCSSAERRTDE